MHLSTLAPKRFTTLSPAFLTKTGDNFSSHQQKRQHNWLAFLTLNDRSKQLDVIIQYSSWIVL
jgi:hypothetical protein